MYPLFFLPYVLKVMRLHRVPSPALVVHVTVTLVPEGRVASTGWLVPACFRMFEDARMVAARDAHFVRAVRTLEKLPVAEPLRARTR